MRQPMALKRLLVQRLVRLMSTVVVYAHASLSGQGRKPHLRVFQGWVPVGGC